MRNRPRRGGSGEPTFREVLGSLRLQMDFPAWPPRTLMDGYPWVTAACLGGALVLFACAILYRVAVDLGLANW